MKLQLNSAKSGLYVVRSEPVLLLVQSFHIFENHGFRGREPQCTCTHPEQFGKQRPGTETRARGESALGLDLTN
jgi:hypothetical protein